MCVERETEGDDQRRRTKGQPIPDLTISLKCRAHSPHGYDLVSISTSCLVSRCCWRLGASGSCAASTWSSVHVALGDRNDDDQRKKF